MQKIQKHKKKKKQILMKLLIEFSNTGLKYLFKPR